MGLSTTSSTEWGGIRRGKTIQDIEKLCRRFEYVHPATCGRLPLQSLSPQPERDLDGSFPTLVIDDNRVERCGDNGIQVWRSIRGDDGTRVSGNRVSDIKNLSGGSGEFGNGISMFRPGGVVVTNNTIRRCDFSAVRNNGGAGVIISANSCADLGEIATFAEFDFEGCIISDNSIDGAICGVQMVNFAGSRGRAAVCSGNIVRNLKSTPSHSGHEFGYECGVKVEADATVSGNVIEGAPWVGILVGWGPSLRDVAVNGNVVCDVPIGIGVSIAEARARR
jgi:uncharacterized secreted repeat protein (TIGR03808 family)